MHQNCSETEKAASIGYKVDGEGFNRAKSINCCTTDTELCNEYHNFQ